MTQIFSIILVIAMAFSSIGGLTANVEDTVSFDAKISVDADALTALSAATGAEMPEETRQTMKVVSDILGALSLKGIASRDAAELDLLAGEDIALSIGAKNTETGVTVASSLLGNDVVAVSKEQIEAMQQTASPQAVSTAATLEKLDREQITKDAEEAFGNLIQAFEAKKGETETGEFTVDEMTFTGKTPVNITYAEAAELVMTSVKELMGRESMKPLAELTGKDIGAEIDKKLEELKNQPETDYPVTELTIYTDADNCAYYVCSAQKAPAEGETQGEKLYIGLGNVDELNHLRMNTETGKQKAEILSVGTKEGTLDMKAVVHDEANQSDAEISVTADGTGNLDLTADIKNATMTGKIVVKKETAEGERNNITLQLFMGDAGQALLTISGTAGKGGEITSVFEGEDVTVTPYETLMSTTDQTAASQFQVKLMAGLLKVISVVTKNVPEDTAAWINAQIKNMMTPQTTTESK